jgi:hypothetical protein
LQNPANTLIVRIVPRDADAQSDAADDFEPLDLGVVKVRQDDLERRYVEAQRDARRLRSRSARAYVDGHIRASLGRLRDAYLQLYQLEDDNPDREWFQHIADKIDQFSTTFPARSRALPLGSATLSFHSYAQLPPIVWLVGFTGVGAWVTERALDCACWGMAIASAIAFVWIMRSMIGGFREKRKAFINLEIYQKERELLDLIHGEPYVEGSPDAVGAFLLTVWFAIAAVVERILGVPMIGSITYGLFAAAFLIVGLASLADRGRRQANH